MCTCEGCNNDIFFMILFFNNNILITICVGRVWIVIRYFLLEKKTFNGLSKVIDIKKKYFFNFGSLFVQ